MSVSTKQKDNLVKYYSVAISSSPRKLKDSNIVVNYAAYQNIPTTDEIVENDKIRQIRWFYGCESIYVDEQIARGHKVDRPTTSMDIIEVINGNLFVDKDGDPRKAEYLAKCNYNGSNKNRTGLKGILFYVDNSEEEATKQNIYEKNVAETKLRILALDDDALTQLAERVNKGGLQFAVNPDEHPDMLKLSLMTHSEKYPDAINDLMVEKNYELKALVADALITGFISIKAGKPYFKDEENPFIKTKEVRDANDIVAFLNSTYGKKATEKLKTFKNG